MDPLVEEQIDALDSGALFSPCRRWRYMLWRRWDVELGTCAFIGLNPSTADETVDDPTIRRCIGFAKSWGYGSFHMLNMYALRSTDPRGLRAVPPHLALGPLNNEYLLAACRSADIVVAAWGTHGKARNDEVVELLTNGGVYLYHLRLTAEGLPGHPLYLPAALQPTLWHEPVRPRGPASLHSV